MAVEVFDDGDGVHHAFLISEHFATRRRLNHLQSGRQEECQNDRQSKAEGRRDHRAFTKF